MSRGTNWLDRLELMLKIQDKVVDVEDAAIAAPGLLTRRRSIRLIGLARDHKCQTSLFSRLCHTREGFVLVSSG